MSAEIDKTYRMTKENASAWGKLIEALVEPGALRLFQDRDIEVYQTFQRVKTQDKNGKQAEFDILLANGDVVIAIEVKTTLQLGKSHLENIPSRIYLCLRAENYLGQLSALSFVPYTISDYIF